MRRGDRLADRLLRFGAAVLRLVAILPADQTTASITRQLARAATAVGANYAEARGAESRRDFIHKLKVADKEAREALYWLSLIAARWDEHECEARRLVTEADELVSILTTSARTAMKRLEGLKGLKE